MNLESELFTWLKANILLVSGRVYNMVAPQDVSTPYLVFQKLNRIPGYAHDGATGFDSCRVQFTAVDGKSCFENLMTRGLLYGTEYEAGDDYRGVWGLYGSYDYISPKIFRVSSTAASVGTTSQWWLSQNLALQGTALAGPGFAAAGTTSVVGQRDYHYGAAAQELRTQHRHQGQRHEGRDDDG